jgi:hypothetical protein
VNAADRLNFLNLACMILAAVLAVMLPLDLFLVAYAVLGPAHYLTELNWLHRRRYFVQRPLAVWALVGVGGGLALANLLLDTHPVAPTWLLTTGASSVFVLTLGLATLAFVQLPWPRAVVFTALLVLTPFCPALYLFLFLFLPTLVHVYLFTGAFLLLGTLRAPRFSAYLTCGAFVACPVLLATVYPHLSGYHSSYAQVAYRAFTPLSTALSQLLPAASPAHALVLATRLIAWAYCYHYLNWFTKTRLIRWHESSPQQLVAMVVLWLGSLALYSWDYATGLRWLYCLSLLHVLLEFPLNRLTLRNLGQYIFHRS